LDSYGEARSILRWTIVAGVPVTLVGLLLVSLSLHGPALIPLYIGLAMVPPVLLLRGTGMPWPAFILLQVIYIALVVTAVKVASAAWRKQRAHKL
jgi:hypothetical protein